MSESHAPAQGTRLRLTLLAGLTFLAVAGHQLGGEAVRDALDGAALIAVQVGFVVGLVGLAATIGYTIGRELRGRPSSDGDTAT